MTLRPRHYILLAVIVALFIFNIVRYRQRKAAAFDHATAVAATRLTPRVDTPTWAAFDAAANLRDAPPAQFDPAVQTLRQQILATQSDPLTPGVQGCLLWLEFYRQGVLHPSTDTSWKARSELHLNGCLKYHLDTNG